jgi:hypothetical protein
MYWKVWALNLCSNLSSQIYAVLSVVFIWRQVAELAIKKVQFQQTLSRIAATCVNNDS